MRRWAHSAGVHVSRSLESVRRQSRSAPIGKTRLAAAVIAITVSQWAIGHPRGMPLLSSSTERFALQPGAYTLGGRGPTAVRLSSLEPSPEVATIVVPSSGDPTIQRLTASVVVRVDRTPIGIAPKALVDGVEIEFNGCRLTFHAADALDKAETADTADAAGTTDTAEHPMIPAWTGEAPVNRRLITASPPFPRDFTRPAARARIVNVRTRDSIDLRDERVVLGRDEGCDFIVQGMGVSRRHCSVTPVQGGYLLRDESANGTMVNGSRVAGTYLLGHDDIIRVGDDELRFEMEGGAAAASGTTAAPTMILDLSRLRSGEQPDAEPERPRAALVANLEIVRGPYSGASFAIDRPVCSIGRSDESDVRIRDESISANHATLLRKGAAWFVVDLRSANGTFVDGLRIAGERELTSGSRLKLGRVELMFRALDAATERTPASRRARSWLRELFAPRASRRQQVAADD